MRTYDSYKDSGIEWIGEIPRHWELKKNKYFTRVVNIKSEDGSEELLSVSEHKGVIPRRDIKEEGELSRSESLEGYKLVKPNQLVSNIMLTWKCGLGVSRYEGIVSPAYSVFEFIKVNPQYYHYLFRTSLYTSEFKRNSTGVIDSRLRLYDDKFGSLFSHFPPIFEQEQIVSYLDEKTSLIDEMVEKKKRKIELLKEFRTSLINTVVTKGLNPDVPMKDSGIEWIGEIPRHWKSISLQKLLQTNQLEFQDGNHGELHPNPNEFCEDGIPFVKPKDIQNGSVDWNGCDKLPLERCLEFRIGFSYNKDILLVNRGGSIGKVCFVHNYSTDNNFFIINPQVTLLRGKHNLSSKFLYYITLSNIFRCCVDLVLGHGSTFPFLGLSNMGNFISLLPPLSEQEQIVSYLDEKTSEIDRTIELENKKIELLKEYRQSLISNVVTGKIKVVSE